MDEAINQDYIIESICNATKEVFEMMLSLDVAAGTPYNEPPATEPVDGVIALLGMAGQYAGTGMIQSEPALACKMSAHLLGSEQPPAAIDGEVLDSVAEVANMIIGNVKNALEEKLGPMGMSIPTVVFGHNFMTRSGSTDPWVVVPFVCDGSNKMIVKVCVTHTPGHGEIRRGFSVPR